MAFEISDEEAVEVFLLTNQKLKGMQWTLENVDKIKGKERMLKRMEIQKALIERLKQHGYKITK